MDGVRPAGRTVVGWLLTVTALASLIGCAGFVATASAASPLTWSSPQLADGATPYGHASGLSAVTCPTESLCVALSELYPAGVLTSTDPTASGSPWKATPVDTSVLNEISCPSASLCAAVDNDGNLVTSTDPSGGPGAWSAPLTVGKGLVTVSCPSAALCVALARDGAALISTDPTGGASAWAPDGALPVGEGNGNYLSCPSVSLCVDMADTNTVTAATTDPMTDKAWTTTAIASGNPGGPPPFDALTGGLSCPSVNLCVAVDGAGDAIVSTDPAGPAPTWTVTPIDAQPLVGVSCPSAGLCVAIDRQGGTVTSTNPGIAWSPTVNIDPNGGLLPGGRPLVALGLDGGNVLGSAGSPGLASVSCPAVTLCVAVDAFGHALTTSDPTGGAAAWNMSVAAPTADTLAAMSCPSTSLCAALDDVGRVVVSTDPAAAQPAWNVTALPDLAASYNWHIACTASPLCVAFDTSEVAQQFQPVPADVSTSPAGGVAAWKSVGDLNRQFVGAACPETGLCLDGFDIMAVAAPKTAHARAPTILPLSGQSSCPSFCITTDFVGVSADLAVQTHPPNGGWTPLQIDSAPALISGVTCPTPGLCIAYDQDGNILYSTQPTGPASSWTSIHPALPDQLTRLACPSATLCVGADDLGDITTTTDPGNPAAWTATLVDPGNVITSLACPSVARCIAGDQSGDVLIGTGPPAPTPAGVSRTAALAALAGALRGSCIHRRAARIIAAGGCATPFTAPGAGTVTLTWRTASGRVIAGGSAHLTHSGRLTVHVRLSRSGTRVLRRSRGRIHLVVIASFRDAASHVYSRTLHIVLAH